MQGILKAYGEDAMVDYMKLVQRFPLRPLRTTADLDAAIAVIDDILDQPTRTKPVADYLDVLSDLVAAYEKKTLRFESVSDSDMLRFLIENKGVTQADLAESTGIAESTVSEILSGRRTLNRRQIGKLTGYFCVGPGVFGFSQ